MSDRAIRCEGLNVRMQGTYEGYFVYFGACCMSMAQPSNKDALRLRAQSCVKVNARGNTHKGQCACKVRNHDALKTLDQDAHDVSLQVSMRQGLPGHVYTPTVCRRATACQLVKISILDHFLAVLLF